MTKIDSAEMNNDKAAAALKNSLVCFAMAEDEAKDRPKLQAEILRISSELYMLLKEIEKGTFK